MLRSIFGIVIGLVVTSLLFCIMGFTGSLSVDITIIPLGLLYFAYHVVHQCLPPLTGGFVAGYITQRRGFLSGISGILIVEIFLLVMGIYSIIRHGAMTEMTVETFLLRWHTWWLTIFRLSAGAAGGLLGQLLAQKWHKPL